MGVWPLELNAQKVNDSLSEPCHVLGGAALQVVEVGQPVLGHETLEVASVGVGGRGLPHKGAAEVELVAHGGREGLVGGGARPQIIVYSQILVDGALVGVPNDGFAVAANLVFEPLLRRSIVQGGDPC